MKTLTTMTAVAALIAGISFASAQNTATPKNPTPPPSSINAGAQTGTGDSKSGSQMKPSAAAKMGNKQATVTGSAKFCITESSSAGSYNCKFASMAACQTEAKPASNKECAPNPNLKATTGMKAK